MHTQTRNLFPSKSDFPISSNWCNYPLISKTNTKFARDYKGDVISDNDQILISDSTKRTINDESFSSFAVKPHTSVEMSKSTISLGKKKSRLLIPNEAIISPWLKFGLEEDPWRESSFHKMPQLVNEIQGGGPLTSLTIASGISYLSQTPDTKAFVVTKLQIANRGLTNIELLRTFRCFQYIDVSWNEINDLGPLENMVYLMCLNASHNKIKDILNLKAPWYLTYVSLACNELTFISDLSEFWSLRHIDLSYNHITEIRGLKSLKYLKNLNLSHNNISYVENLGGLMIEELNLGYNEINTWEVNEDGLININHEIKSLNFSNNCLETLSFLQGLGCLKELFVSNNRISSIEELDYLKELKVLQNISLYENEISSLESYKSILIYYLPQIVMIDYVKVINAEREAATILFTPELLVQQYRHHARLLLYEQLTNPSIQTDTQACGAKAYPIVCLVGPHGCSKLSLAKRIAEEFSQFVYAATNHVMTSLNTRAYERMIDNKFVLNEDKFNEMIRLGQFLATSELIGFSYGLSREEFSRSIEEGKLCLVNADILMAFCLQALGLNPYLILTIVNDVELHSNRIMRAYTQPAKGSLLEVQFDALLKIQNPGSYTLSSTKPCSTASRLGRKSKYKSSQRISPTTQETESSRENLHDLNEPLKEFNFDVFDEIDKITKTDRLDQQISSVQITVEPLDSKHQVASPSSSGYTYDSSFCDSVCKETYRISTPESNEFPSTSNINRDKVIDYNDKRKTSNLREKRDSENLNSPKFQSPNMIVYLNPNELNADEYPDDLESCESSITPINMKSFSDKILTPKRRPRTSQYFHGTNESVGEWSWTTSNDSLTTTDEEEEYEDSSEKSSSLSMKPINYIMKKIIESRKVYQDLQDTGYFYHIIHTDNVDEAYDNLKRVICHIYNTKDDWSSLYSFEKDPLYEDVVNAKTTKLMDELDKTESTASLKKQ